MTTATLTLEERVAALDATMKMLSRLQVQPINGQTQATGSVVDVELTDELNRIIREMREANPPSLEERVDRLELAVERLRAHLRAQQNAWLASVPGKITDVEAFDEAMALGREFRRTGKLPEPPEEQP